MSRLMFVGFTLGALVVSHVTIFPDPLVAAETVAVSVTDDPSHRSWQRTESSIALMQGENLVWQFNFGPMLNVPFFDPVSTTDGRVLSWNEPPDHAWHHGLWFCWKFINGVNYWEHQDGTDKPEGRTAWSDVHVDLREDHSARIELALSYRPAEYDQDVLIEQRTIDISAPDAQGEYTIDWSSSFTAIEDDVTLDRVPPKEQSWGGYAGLSVRFAKNLTQRQAISTGGSAEFGAGDRHRSRAAAMDYSGEIDGKPVGLAFLDHPDNPRHPTPWYCIRSPVMSYINAAVLADEPMVLRSRQRMTLRYRLLIHPSRWTVERLKAAYEDFSPSPSTTENR